MMVVVMVESTTHNAQETCEEIPARPCTHTHTHFRFGVRARTYRPHTPPVVCAVGPALTVSSSCLVCAAGNTPGRSSVVCVAGNTRYTPKTTELF